MQVTEVRLVKAQEQDSCLAYGSFTLDGDFVVKGIRVMVNKDREKFVCYPSHKNSKGDYKDVCFPMAQSLREDINIAVLAEYEKL